MRASYTKDLCLGVTIKQKLPDGSDRASKRDMTEPVELMGINENLST